MKSVRGRGDTGVRITLTGLHEDLHDGGDDRGMIER